MLWAETLYVGSWKFGAPVNSQAQIMQFIHIGPDKQRTLRRMKR